MRQQSSVNAKSLPEQTVVRIQDYINQQNLVAGDKLPNEFQLAEICGVGRSTVRDAIKILTFEGQVEVVHGSGTYIKKEQFERDDDPMGLQNMPDPYKTALDFFEIRLMLEPEIASMAATNATYEDCQRLIEINKEVERDVSRGIDHLEADTKIHTQIAVCSKNPVVINLMGIVNTGIMTFGNITEHRLADDTVKFHAMIVDAIVDGDAVGARCAMVSHLNNNRQEILRMMKKRDSQKREKDN